MAGDMDVIALVKKVVDDLKTRFDAEHGEFGNAPKFQVPINNQVTAHVCKNFQCNLYVTEKGKMLQLLQEIK